MLNKSSINHTVLDGTDGPPPTPPVTGFGILIYFEQWVVADPLPIVKNPLNARRINWGAIDREELLVGRGELIAIEQIVGVIGVGEEIAIVQSVGKKASGEVVQIEQTLIHSVAGGGDIITIEQNVANFRVGNLIAIEQYIIDPAVTTTHYQKFGWDAIITLGGAQIPIDQIYGEIKIDRAEAQASLAEFTIIPPAGFINAEAYTGKTVTIDVHTSHGFQRIYTGIVDIPELDLIEKKVTMKCTDRRTELVNDQLPAIVGSIGYFSPIIFQNIKDTADELEKRLSTTPYSVDFDAFGNYTLTSWFAKSSPDFTFSNSDVYYEKPKVQIGSRGRVTNTININFQYRYDRLHHTERHFNWTSPIAQNIMLLLQWGYSMTFRERVKTAADATGWPMRGSINFTPIWPSGWYNGIGWSTVQFTYSTANASQTSVDPVSGQTTVSTVDSTVSFADASGNTVTANAITGGTDYGPLYCMAASWFGTFRWVQTITENYTLEMVAPQSVAQYDTIESTESYSAESKFDSAVWENYKAYTDADIATKLVSPTASIVGDPLDSYYINADLNRGEMLGAAYTVMNKAKTTILGSHRDTKVIVNMFLFPSIDLRHTCRVNTDTVVAKGKTYGIEHILNVGTGEAQTTITLALFKSQGSTTDSTIGLPGITPDAPDPTSGNVILGNHFGEDPTTDAAQSWNGMVGNRFLPAPGGGTTARTTYQEYFKVDAPAIPDTMRQGRDVFASGGYNVRIPDDELTIIF